MIQGPAQNQFSNAGMNGGVQAGYPAPPPEPTIMANISGRLEVVNGNLIDSIDRLQGLLTRLHGPRPEPKAELVSGRIGTGSLLDTLDERIGWLLDNSNRLTDLALTLGKIA